jgi:hypothetical protein
MVKQSLADDIIKKIMSQAVPSKGELIHPLSNEKVKKGSKQVTLTDAKNANMPTDVNLWTPKHFVDYFAKRYQEVTGANYRKIYNVEIGTFVKIGDFLVSNGLDRNLWTKKFIDWAFKHKDDITHKEGHFTPQEILRQINYFYQQEILPMVEEDEIVRDTQDTLLLEEIQLVDSEGKSIDIFIKFGIPTTTTYYAKIKGIDITTIEEATLKMIKRLSIGGSMEKKQLENILHASVIGSPYPPEFLGLDWREKIAQDIKIYTKEPWWRREDYKGKPLSKYNSLTGE